MGELLDTILGIILQQGLAGAVLIVLGYAYYQRGKKLDNKDEEIKGLHIEMLKAANDDNSEKIEYLNQHLVLLTKATDSMTANTSGLTEVKGKQDQLLNEFAKIEGKLTNG